MENFPNNQNIRSVCNSEVYYLIHILINIWSYINNLFSKHIFVLMMLYLILIFLKFLIYEKIYYDLNYHIIQKFSYVYIKM